MSEPFKLSQEHKDELKELAMQAYQKTYGGPLSFNEAFLITKGIEAMAAIMFVIIEDKQDEISGLWDEIEDLRENGNL